MFLYKLSRHGATRDTLFWSFCPNMSDLLWRSCLMTCLCFPDVLAAGLMGHLTWSGGARLDLRDPNKAARRGTSWTSTNHRPSFSAARLKAELWTRLKKKQQNKTKRELYFVWNILSRKSEYFFFKSEPRRDRTGRAEIVSDIVLGQVGMFAALSCLWKLTKLYKTIEIFWSKEIRKMLFIKHCLQPKL